MDRNYFRQSTYNIRCEWGLEGLLSLRPISDLIVIVDVLSFSTCVEIATTRGAAILPYRFKDETAETFAKANGAISAHTTRTRDRYSLSPRSLTNIEAGCRLVLPSPNGSELSLMSAEGATVAGCLRNATAIAKYANTMGSVAVIACGERWERNKSLRPALEDMLGAGAIISKLSGKKSPEALAAQAVFESVNGNLEEHLSNCASGIELIERNDREDVILASQMDVSNTVPILKNGEYRKLA